MSKALVPKGSVNTKEKSSEATQRPSDRRRLLGFILLVLAAFILLPELKHAGEDQMKPQLQSWSEPPEMFEAPSQVKPQQVENVELNNYHEIWSSEYEDYSDAQDVTEVAALDADQESQHEPTALIEEPRQEIADSQLQTALQPAFMVQAGTFKNAENARDLVKTLESMGFRSFIKTQSEYHRVIVGPQLRRQEAEKALASLAEKLSIQGMVKPYTP